MNPKVSDLISALPDWEKVPDTEDRQAREDLKELLAGLSSRPVPIGSFHRLPVSSRRSPRAGL